MNPPNPAQAAPVRASKANLAVEFHLFPMLPTEIRLKIWQYHIPDRPPRRTIEVGIYNPGDPPNLFPFKLWHWSPLLNVNREARAEILRGYHSCLPSRYPNPNFWKSQVQCFSQPTYFDFSRDKLYFNSSTLWALQEPERIRETEWFDAGCPPLPANSLVWISESRGRSELSMAEYYDSLCQPELRSCVQSLAFDSQLFNGQGRLHPLMIEDFVNLLRHFGKLKTITLVFRDVEVNAPFRHRGVVQLMRISSIRDLFPLRTMSKEMLAFESRFDEEVMGPLRLEIGKQEQRYLGWQGPVVELAVMLIENKGRWSVSVS